MATIDERDVSLMLRAFRHAADGHRDKRRKGAVAAPKINHLIEVADILWETGGIRDPRIIAAAILHDILEDTDETAAGIGSRFGGDIAAVVSELTDDKSLPVTERRERQVAHAATLSAPAAQIKLADKISNLASVAESPPEKWTAADLLGYAGWGKRVVDKLRGVNPRLEEQFDSIYADVLRTYGARASGSLPENTDDSKGRDDST